MQIFNSVSDFILFTNQLKLRHKNNVIARQRHANGVHLLEKINEVFGEKQNVQLSETPSKC